MQAGIAQSQLTDFQDEVAKRRKVLLRLGHITADGLLTVKGKAAAEVRGPARCRMRFVRMQLLCLCVCEIRFVQLSCCVCAKCTGPAVAAQMLLDCKLPQTDRDCSDLRHASLLVGPPRPPVLHPATPALCDSVADSAQRLSRRSTLRTS